MSSEMKYNMLIPDKKGWEDGIILLIAGTSIFPYKETKNRAAYENFTQSRRKHKSVAS